jgi:maltose O-acetyltransferase
MRSLNQFIGGLKARWLLRQKVDVFGNFTVVDPRKVRIGTKCAINPGVFILGYSGVTIGEGVILSTRCMLIDAALDPERFLAGERTYVDAPIVIGDGVWIGAGAIILAGVTVGAGSIVGAGSVVTRDVPPGTIVAGNPARVLHSAGAEARGHQTR